MGVCAVVWRMLPVAAITTLASALALGAGAAAAGAGLAPAGAAGPVPFEPFMTGVSCPTTSMCMAVGMHSMPSGLGQIPLAGIWNGRTWRWMAQPPEPRPDSGLVAVACVSATRCIALGNTDASSNTGGFAFGDEWNGRTWRAMPSMAGVAFDEPHGLSCVTAAYCVAVGASSMVSNPVAEVWNGRVWKGISPTAWEGTLSGVSCTSVSRCMAVGRYGSTTFASAVAASWNGRTWTIRTVQAGSPGFEGVSCPRVHLCVAVGERPVAEVWNGSRWRELTPPDPGKFADGPLAGVSCASANRCIAVGQGPKGAFAVAWTGGTRLKTLAVPAQPTGVPELDAVSCARSTRCMAVSGNQVGEGSPIGEISLLGDWALLWNGRSWRGVRQARFDVLAAVSCPSSSGCVAAGTFLNKSDGFQALAQSWGGKTWRLMSPRHVRGDFRGVSCLSRSFCMATGRAGPRIWDGSRWKLAAAGDSADVLGQVSCATRRFCAATGFEIGEGFGFVVWNGVKWRFMNLAAPASADQPEIFSVSCTGPRFCLAVGNYSASEEFGPDFTLANIWNGRTWRLVTSPAPGGSSFLTGVSCLPRAGCMAVGSYFDTSGFHNLAERFNHGTWQVITMPGHDATRFPGPDSVSCSLATSCVAVGSAAGQLHSLLVTAQVWNGTAWQSANPASPARLAFLDSVSCASPTFCIAVGQAGNLALTERWNGHAWKQLTEANP